MGAVSVLRRLTSACHRSSELYYGRNNVVESPRSLQTGDTQSYATAASLDQLLIRPKTGESVSTVDTARTTDSDQIKHFVIETLQGRNALAAINVAAAKFAASGRTPTEMKEFQISMLDEARSAITVRGMARMHELCRAHFVWCLQRHVNRDSLAPILRRSTPTRHQATLAGMVRLSSADSPCSRFVYSPFCVPWVW